MLTQFKDLNAGDFFIFKLGNEVNVYQKISQQDHYNCVHLNTGQICNVYEENTKVNKVEIELKIHE